MQVSRERRLTGVVSLRALLLAEPTQRLEQIIACDLRYLVPEAPAARVAQIRGEHTNGRASNALAWATVVAAAGLSLLMVVTTVRPALGLHVFGL